MTGAVKQRADAGVGSEKMNRPAAGGRTGELFDDWPERYDRWFTTPIGALVRRFESELLLAMIAPRPGERLLDVGCGTGLFTADVLAAGGSVIGLDPSLPMLGAAARRLAGKRFTPLAGDMRYLPFADTCFDGVYSMTALEFVADARGAVAELERVTRPGGTIVVTTLNGLSPWAARRIDKGRSGHPLFREMIFRTPAQLRKLAPNGAEVRTVVHFDKNDEPAAAERVEAEGQRDGRETGACVAVRWVKK